MALKIREGGARTSKRGALPVTKPSHQPTVEQAEILATPVRPGDVLLLNAYAGTGKTTTLEMYARAYPEKRFLYICFNRDNAEEARRKFPRNCDCRTTHSMAWQAVGRNFPEVASPRPRLVMDAFGISTPYLAVYVLDTLNRFLHSTDESLFPGHVECGPDTTEEQRAHVLGVAARLWEAMQDPARGELPMSHDGYLKLWALGQPAFEGYDGIFLDEAQDTNPVTLGVVLSQVEARRAALVLVGDTHQSIYRWRHATDAMDAVRPQATHELSLTESFRFGDGIAQDAALLLRYLKDDPVELRGLRSSETTGDGGARLSYAVLGRTNAEILAAAMEKARDGMPIHFAATEASRNWDPFVPYKFQMTLDVFRLWNDEASKVRDPYLKRFESYSELEEHAVGEGSGGAGRDVEIALQIELVETHGDEIPRLLDLLQTQATSPREARLSFSTAHRAKGREWDCVRILGDFLEISDPELFEELDPGAFVEEVNLLYVSATRARSRILYPDWLLSWIEEHQEDGAPDEHRIPIPDKEA